MWSFVGQGSGDHPPANPAMMIYLRSTWWKLNILETSWFLIEKFKKLKIFKPSAHNAIVSEENSKDSNDNVRAADADNSDHIVNILSVRTGI